MTVDFPTLPEPASAARPAVSRRNAASRTAILDAAFELVGSSGYDKLTIEAIAARAGVGKQTIYRWWPSKGAVLLDAVLRMTTGDPSGAADEAASPSTSTGAGTGLLDTGDFAADLREILRATVAEFSDASISAPLRALTIAILQDADLAASYEQALDRPTRELKRERLRSAQRAGQLRDDVDLDVAIDTIFDPLAQRWLLGRPLTLEYADALTDASLRSLAPTPAR